MKKSSKIKNAFVHPVVPDISIVDEADMKVELKPEESGSTERQHTGYNCDMKLVQEVRDNSIIETHGMDGGESWTQVLAVVAVCLGPFTTGILFVWSSPFTLVIIEDKINYNITEHDAALFMTFQPIGMIVTGLFSFQISELIGRKKTLLLLAVPQVLCWIVTIFARTKWEFNLARFIAGIADAIMFCSVPPYVGEITTPTVRGYLGNTPTLVHYAGQLFITVIGSYFDVQSSSYICIGIPIFFFLMILFLPESPYQLIKDGKMDEAREAIKWLRRKTCVEDDFHQMKADVERQISESGTWKDLVTISSNRKALRAGIFLRLSQQFCGVSTFATYTQLVFQKTGGNLSPQYSSVIFIGLIFIMNFFCSISVEKFGRKPSYFYSLLSAACVLFSLATYFFIDQFNLANVEYISWYPLVGMIVFVFMYSFGLGVVPTLMLGELFSASIKSKGLAVLIAAFGVGILVTTNIFHTLTANVGLFSPFLLYSLSCFLSTFLTYKWVPETKGKTLEEIQQSLKNNRQ